MKRIIALDSFLDKKKDDCGEKLYKAVPFYNLN
jgi:hypothetical protein